MSFAYSSLAFTTVVHKSKYRFTSKKNAAHSQKTRRVACVRESADTGCFDVSPPARRRDVMFAAASIPAGISLLAEAPGAAYAGEKKSLSKGELLTLTTEEVKKVVNEEDANKVLRLLLADAGTYNVDEGTGGINGSIHFGEELARPENEGLSEICERLGNAKAAVDAVAPIPISWADLIVVACKVAIQKTWLALKIARAPDPGSGKVIAEAFGTAWTINLGRVDATDASPPDPAGRVPSGSASVSEMKTFFDTLGMANGGVRGPFAPKPTIGARQQFLLMPYLLSGDPEENEARMVEEFPDDYASWKKKYDKNRITATRTDYEVDFIDAVARVARLGVNYNPDLYSY